MCNVQHYEHSNYQLNFRAKERCYALKFSICDEFSHLFHVVAGIFLVVCIFFSTIFRVKCAFFPLTRVCRVYVTLGGAHILFDVPLVSSVLFFSCNSSNNNNKSVCVFVVVDWLKVVVCVIVVVAVAFVVVETVVRIE